MGAGFWLAGMAGTLTAKVLIALGLQVVTITGVTVAIATLKALVFNGLGGIPSAAFQLVLLTGFGQAMGMILGAIAFRLALWQINGATKILGVAS